MRVASAAVETVLERTNARSVLDRLRDIPAEVFSCCQDHVVGAAGARRADGSRGLARQAGDARRRTREGHLDRVCDLFALSCIESDRAWFLEPGRLSNARSEAVTRRVNQLCRRIRPLAGDLVDALAVPPDAPRRAAHVLRS
jgi:acyl-CoA oxidase